MYKHHTIHRAALLHASPARPNMKAAGLRGWCQESYIGLCWFETPSYTSANPQLHVHFRLFNHLPPPAMAGLWLVVWRFAASILHVVHSTDLRRNIQRQFNFVAATNEPFANKAHPSASSIPNSA